MTIKDFSTKELVEELSNRGGISRTDIAPYEVRQMEVEGPAIVFTVTD